MPRFSECWRCGNTVGVGIICELCGVAKYCSERCQRNDIFRHEAECIPASILKTCTTCRKSGPNLKACAGCYRVFYCDTNCQRSNWDRHKIDCEDVKEMIKILAQRILTHFSRSGQTASSSGYFYWGNVPAFDCLNLVENESEDYSSALKILFLGVGDLRNVALTCESLPDSYSNKVLFTLNDKESCVLARLVLLLYMLIKGDFGVENKVTEIWYSILLTEPTYKYLRTSIEELVNLRNAENLKTATAGLISIEEKQFRKLRDVWENWLYLGVEGTDWIQNQRIEKFQKHPIYHKMFLDCLEHEHVATAMKWIKDGVFQRTQSLAIIENPTLTGYEMNNRGSPYSYCIQDTVFPFCGWDYLQVKKFKNSSCLVTMYGEYIESVLRSFMKKLSKRQVHFQIVLSDCIDIKQHLEVEVVYDRILTSNLMDYIFLLDLLKLCSELLNKENTRATIVTQTMTWDRIYWPEKGLRPNYLQQAFGKWMKIALEDIRRSSSNVSDSACLNSLEYLDESCEFNDYLRSQFYAYGLRQEMENEWNTPEYYKIPTKKDLGKSLQLRLREGVRNENTIVFFKPAVNRRRANRISPSIRNLEWINTVFN